MDLVPYYQATKQETMKTIKVRFPGNCKEYAFNVEDPCNHVCVDSTIYLPAYQSAVCVVAIYTSYLKYVDTRTQMLSNCKRTSSYIPIKLVRWELMENKAFKPSNTFTLEEAKALYKQGGVAAEFACKYFPEEELLGIIPKSSLALWQMGMNNATEVLQKLANTLNKGWRKTHGNTGYFCSPRSDGGWDILNHTMVNYPGVVYFKEENYAWAALKQLHPVEREALKGC